MVDIINELYHIETDILGKDVRNVIGAAMEKLVDGLNVDISAELTTIYNGRYGSDIRMAIHDALNKLSKAAPTPVAIDYIAGFTVPKTYGISTNIYGETTNIDNGGE